MATIAAHFEAKCAQNQALDVLQNKNLRLRRRPEINEPTPHPSLRAQRSNPGAASRGPWIASSQELLAMTEEASPSSRFGSYWASPYYPGPASDVNPRMK